MRTVNPGPGDDIDEPTERWLEDMDVVLDGLRHDMLPRDFPFDFSAASLTRLEPLVVDGWPPDGPLDDFLRAALTYVGEALMRVAGGRWRWSDGPVVSFDPALGLGDLSLTELADRAAERDDDRVFAETYARLTESVTARRSREPGWEPVKLATLADPSEPPPSAELDEWLRRQEAGFAAWAAEHADDGPWDFSERSIEALERVLLSSAAAGTAVDPDAGDPAVDVPAWYFGETLIRNGTGRWTFSPGERTVFDLTGGRPVVRPPDPDRSLVVPTITVASMVEERGAGDLVRWFARFTGR